MKNIQINSDTFQNILIGKYYMTSSDFNKFYTKNRNTSKIEVILYNVTVTESIHIGGIDFPYEITISKCMFLGDITISDSTIKFLRFITCNINNNLSILNSFINKFKVESSQVLKKLTLLSTSINTLVFFQNRSLNIVLIDLITNSVSVLRSDSQNISILGNYTFIDTFNLGDNTKNFNLNISKGVINNCYLSGFLNKLNTIIISNTFINTFKLWYISGTGKILLHNIISIPSKKINSSIKFSQFVLDKKIDNIRITAIMDYNHMSSEDMDMPLDKIQIPANNEQENFNDVKKYWYDSIIVWDEKKKQSKLIFENVGLSNISIKYSDLNLFDSIEITNTELSTLKLFNTFIPPLKTTGNPELLYETFNDLHITAKNRNNIKDQISYLKASKQFLLQSLVEKKSLKNLSSISSLLVSKLFSNFGTNWIKSMLITFLLSSLSFIALMLLSHYDLNFTEEGLETSRLTLPYFFQFLNPTHGITFLDGKFNDLVFSNNTYFVILDLFGRIIIGIGIYETITAFRKFKIN